VTLNVESYKDFGAYFLFTVNEYGTDNVSFAFEERGKRTFSKNIKYVCLNKIPFISELIVKLN